jgi:hypothetical protein
LRTTRAAAPRGSISIERKCAAPARTFASVALTLLCLLCSIMASPSVPANDMPCDDDDCLRPYVVGVVVQGHEIGTLDTYRDTQFYLPLEPFLALVGAHLSDDKSELTITTPLGPVTLEEQDVIRIEGGRYLPQEAVEHKLASPMTFVPHEFAISIDLAWQLPLSDRPARGDRQIEPDAHPPSFGLSTIRVDTRLTQSSLYGDRLLSNTAVAGVAAGGRWQARFLSDLESDPIVQDYDWVGIRARQLWLIGHQRVQVHPLLPGVELTGAQHGYTNEALQLFAREPGIGELLPRRLRPVDTYSGFGPPAGVAELRINGTVISRSAIGLDGYYEFADVPAPTHHYAQVEALVYERHDLQVPVEIQDLSRATSVFLLPEGAVVHQGGLGLSGNLLQDAIDGRREHDLAGFYQGRFGLTRRLTLEGAIELLPDRFFVLGGVTARPLRNLTLSAAVAHTGSAGGYHLELESLHAGWYARGHTQYSQAGFQSTDAMEYSDHFLELGFSRLRRVQLAMIARTRDVAGRRHAFILPSLSWRPSSGLAAYLRPDEEGDLTLDISFMANDRTRLALRQQDGTYADVSVRLSNHASALVASELGHGALGLQSAAIELEGGGSRRPSVSLGALYSGGRLGYRTNASIMVFPCAFMRLDLDDLPVPGTGQRNRRLALGFTTDLSIWNRRLVPARSTTMWDERGGVAGCIRVVGSDGHLHFPLQNQRIRVDNRPMTTTSAGGCFFAGDLAPGVHRVELDTENLAIELQPVKAESIAEVTGGAVTHVTFTVTPSYGIAGRVVDPDNKPIAGVCVELVNGDGKAQTATTDQFGLYRLDMVTPGSYELHPCGGQLPESSSRAGLTIKVRDDFVFGADLKLPTRPREDHAAVPPH